MFNKFLEELDRKSIRIAYNGGKLTFEGPEEHITPELIENLKKYKASLIKYYWPAECVNMMPINPLGSKIPFTLIYFEVMNYPLSEFFGPDQPFYGFLHYGSRGEKIKYKNVESFASDYIIQLQKIIPKGPYFLGGFSFGGMLALEMSIQLQKAGHDVPFLALLDSKTSVAFAKPLRQKGFIKYLRSNILGPFKRRMQDRVRFMYCNFYLLFNKPVPLNLRNFYIVEMYRRLTMKYKPGKFKGEVLLFRSEEANPDYPYNGFEPFVDKVNVVGFKGGHLTIAREKEYARVLGTEFLNHLSKVWPSS
jgi:thioesterase domain-containing protein